MASSLQFSRRTFAHMLGLGAGAALLAPVGTPASRLCSRPPAFPPSPLRQPPPPATRFLRHVFCAMQCHSERSPAIGGAALKSGDDELVEQDIRGVVEASHAGGALCKVILECAVLTDQEKVRGCQLALLAGADFVKTSTGFGPGGATAQDVELMRMVVGQGMGVKAAGGIRTYEDLQKMVQAGATRIGASASVKIVQQAAGVPVESAAPAAATRY